MLVLVTGATGFVGKAVLARCITNRDLRLRAAHRRDTNSLDVAIERVTVGDIQEDTDWSRAVRGVDTVVHAAARVHVMQDTSADPLYEFRRVNVAGSLNLARQAAAAGVRRFVFISSIKVNGDRTVPGQKFHPDDVPAPSDPYGVSKNEAEHALRRVARDTGMDVVIIRPVLVYGPGVKANFLSMMRWVHAGIPLPFGAVQNCRSFVALDNLTDLIHTSLLHPAAANQTFLVSDGDDMSTSVLLRRMANAFGARSRLISVPTSVLRNVMRLAGKEELARRLFASLRVDIEKTRQLLGWTPPRRVEDALSDTAQWFLQRAHGRSALDGGEQSSEQ